VPGKTFLGRRRDYNIRLVHNYIYMILAQFINVYVLRCSRKNVCVTKEEVDLGAEDDIEGNATTTGLFAGLNTRTQTCSGDDGRYMCTTTVHGSGKHVRTTVKYECCQGFRLEGHKCRAGQFLLTLFFADS